MAHNCRSRLHSDTVPTGWNFDGPPIHFTDSTRSQRAGILSAPAFTPDLGDKLPAYPSPAAQALRLSRAYTLGFAARKFFLLKLLSSRTKTAQSLQVMRDLERAFPGSGPGNWEPVRDASVPEIERAIAIVTFPEQKAPRLKAALEQITARTGALSLDFLHRYRTDKIRACRRAVRGRRPSDLCRDHPFLYRCADARSPLMRITCVSFGASALFRAPMRPSPKSA